jgi:hypothetical protein
MLLAHHGVAAQRALRRATGLHRAIPRRRRGAGIDHVGSILRVLARGRAGQNRASRTTRSLLDRPAPARDVAA